MKVVFVTEAQPELVLLSERAPGRRRHDWLDGGESTREEGDDKSTAFAAAGLHGLDRSAAWHGMTVAEQNAFMRRPQDDADGHGTTCASVVDPCARSSSPRTACSRPPTKWTCSTG